MLSVFPAGYQIRRGTGLDRAALVKFMQQTYQELYPEAQFHHLAQTVDQYFSSETPLWWVDVASPLLEGPPEAGPAAPAGPAERPHATPIACLWLGRAVDQVTGQGYPYIFLLYVSPAHRRRGLGSGLVQQAEAWAVARGDGQLGLQVFHHNQSALRLYEALGFQPQAIAMVKPLQPNQLPQS
jgi:ribosomal protein S18 acetylase RimI-like enzyme